MCIRDRAHRGKLRKVEVALTDRQFVLQLVCLRLAVALCLSLIHI